MNIKEIRDLIDLLTEKGIAEFELERSGTRIRISRQGAVRMVAEASVQPASPAPAVQKLAATGGAGDVHHRSHEADERD
jgi:hypothetical protein